jgi:hypothetical protein
VIENGHPPGAVLKVINPIFKTLLRSPLARFAPPMMVVISFKGRKSGRPYDLVVGWHEVGGEHFVFSPARWPLNFRGGAPVEVRRGSLRRTYTGTLVSDPEVIAPLLQAAVDAGQPRDLGLKMDADDKVTPEAVRTVGRRMIRLS